MEVDVNKQLVGSGQAPHHQRPEQMDMDVSLRLASFFFLCDRDLLLQETMHDSQAASSLQSYSSLFYFFI